MSGWLLVITYCALIGTDTAPSCGAKMVKTLHQTRDGCERAGADHLAGLINNPKEGHTYLFSASDCARVDFGTA